MLDTHLHAATLRSVSKKVSLVGQQIKAFRLERGMTQKQMAAYLGISRATLNRLERGKGELMDLTYAKIMGQLSKAQAAVA
jgi:DNA-binding XRE family transcriptional regulator